MTKKIAVSDAKENLPRYLREAEVGEPVLITRYGRPVAALVSLDAWERLERVDSASPAAGLAGLVGLWDDGDELADEMQNTVRNRLPPRPAEDLPDLVAGER